MNGQPPDGSSPDGRQADDKLSTRRIPDEALLSQQMTDAQGNIPVPPDPNGRGHLLVIDDEDEILKALQRQFRRDYHVYTARSADEGYNIMLEHPVQVIISDQRMPGMTGHEFFSKVKQDYPDAIRLLLTG
ncbi:MAG: response regulator, partial [Chloroflexi bacterium]|nr:response regulator [Chloroflexota bacterium]